MVSKSKKEQDLLAAQVLATKHKRWSYAEILRNSTNYIAKINRLNPWAKESE
jgi:hypothetical protein